MIISLPDDIPAARFLRDEGLVVVDDENPVLSMLRPLRVALVNLMPNKPVTELQFARLLAHAPFPVQLTLVRPHHHVSRSTCAHHLDRFYRTIPEILDDSFDGLVVTGAPVEHLHFEDVDYWREIEVLLDWADARVSRSLFVCWAAQAALFHRHGIDKLALRRKAFGVFEQTVRAPEHAAVWGLGLRFATPVSRHTDVDEGEVARRANLEILAASPDTGLGLVEEASRGALMMFNHLEYDTMSLEGEYRRDLKLCHDVAAPAHYYPCDDPKRIPVNRWAPAAQRFFSNWIVDMVEDRRYSAAPARDRLGTLAVAG
jgi:homoserine O-succinyltransferase